MTTRLTLVLFALGILGLATIARAATFLDSVVAEVQSDVVTASDVALAHRLGLFGLPTGDAPIDAVAVDRLVGVRLALGEARTLGLTASDDELDAGWRAAAAHFGGVRAFDTWLDARAIEREWARRLVADDVVWRRFVNLRFRTFVFVGPDELAAELGPGAHSAEEETRARERLVERETTREVEAWLAERAKAVRVRHLLAPGATVANPLGETGK